MKRLDVSQRFEIAGIIGVAGGLVALAITGVDRHLSFDWGFVRVACAGAFVAGLACADGFGHRGWRGMLGGGVSFVLATLIGAYVAFLAMPFEHWWFGAGSFPGRPGAMGISEGLIAPLFVVSSVLSSGQVAGIWVAGACAAQATAAARRARQDAQMPRINPGNCGSP